MRLEDNAYEYAGPQVVVLGLVKLEGLIKGSFLFVLATARAIVLSIVRRWLLRVLLILRLLWRRRLLVVVLRRHGCRGMALGKGSMSACRRGSSRRALLYIPCQTLSMRQVNRQTFDRTVLPRQNAEDLGVDSQSPESRVQSPESRPRCVFPVIFSEKSRQWLLATSAKTTTSFVSFG